MVGQRSDFITDFQLEIIYKINCSFSSPHFLSWVATFTNPISEALRELQAAGMKFHKNILYSSFSSFRFEHTAISNFQRSIADMQMIYKMFLRKVQTIIQRGLGNWFEIYISGGVVVTIELQSYLTVYHIILENGPQSLNVWRVYMMYCHSIFFVLSRS